MLGTDYTGTVAVTRNGKTCDQWINWDFYDGIEDSNFPDGSIVAASNYCRNPDHEPLGPWCFRVTGQWGYCSIPMCEVTTEATPTTALPATGMSTLIYIVTIYSFGMSTLHSSSEFSMKA